MTDAEGASVTGRRRSLRLLGLVVLAALAVQALLGLVVAPPDANQGDAQRLMYVHVPSAWLAFLAFGVTSLTSALYLMRRTRAKKWDRMAASSAELGVMFTGMALMLGMLWGRPIWGAYWTWDARLVTTALLFFLYLGYLALRRVIADPEARARRCAVAALIAFADVPIVHFSVVWWRTLHQQATVLNPKEGVQIHGTMLLALLWGVFTFTLAYVYLLNRRYRLAEMEEQLEDRMLDVAIAERRAADVPAWATVGLVGQNGDGSAAAPAAQASAARATEGQ